MAMKILIDGKLKTLQVPFRAGDHWQYNELGLVGGTLRPVAAHNFSYSLEHRAKGKDFKLNGHTYQIPV